MDAVTFVMSNWFLVDVKVPLAVEFVSGSFFSLEGGSIPTPSDISL